MTRKTLPLSNPNSLHSFFPDTTHLLFSSSSLLYSLCFLSPFSLSASTLSTELSPRSSLASCLRFLSAFHGFRKEVHQTPLAGDLKFQISIIHYLSLLSTLFLTVVLWFLISFQKVLVRLIRWWGVVFDLRTAVVWLELLFLFILFSQRKSSD